MSKTTKRIEQLVKEHENKYGYIPHKKVLATHLHEEVIRGKIEASEKAHKQYILGHTKVDYIPFEELEKMALANIESDKALYEAEVKLADLERQINKTTLTLSDVVGLDKIVLPRQIAMFLSRQLTNLSLPEIGSAFGGKDHTTVLHSCKKMEAQKQADQSTRNTLEKLLTDLKQ